MLREAHHIGPKTNACPPLDPKIEEDIDASIGQDAMTCRASDVTFTRPVAVDVIPKYFAWPVFAIGGHRVRVYHPVC
jgi:hypothetical protein